MDWAGVGGALGGAGTLVGALGALLPARRRRARELARCIEERADLQTTVGFLVSLLPGGALAQRYRLYGKRANDTVAPLMEQVRREAHNRARGGQPPG